MTPYSTINNHFNHGIKLDLVGANRASAFSVNDAGGAMLSIIVWRLGLTDTEVSWHSGEDVWEHKPNTKLSRWVKSRLLQVFPIEKYL